MCVLHEGLHSAVVLEWDSIWERFILITRKQCCPYLNLAHPLDWKCLFWTNVSNLCNFICWKTMQTLLVQALLDTWCMKTTMVKRACHLVLVIGPVYVQDVTVTHSATFHFNVVFINQRYGGWCQDTISRSRCINACVYCQNKIASAERQK